MRTFSAVMAASLLAGILGAWTLGDAVSEYNGTLRTYRRLSIDYRPGSFVWYDDSYTRGRMTLVFTNSSPADALIDGLKVSAGVYYGRDFAGRNYDSPESFTVRRGESYDLTLEFEITTPGLPPGGEADLSLRGSALALFDGIDRPLTLRIDESVGQVDTVEPPP